METKKIVFKKLNKVLSENEMKHISGGYGGGSGGWYDNLKTCKSKSDCDVLTQNCGLICGDVKKCY